VFDRVDISALVRLLTVLATSVGSQVDLHVGRCVRSFEDLRFGILKLKGLRLLCS